MPIGMDLPHTITRLDRDRLEKLMTVAIEYSDNLDGDPDLERDDHERCEAFDDRMYSFCKWPEAMGKPRE